MSSTEHTDTTADAPQPTSPAMGPHPTDVWFSAGIAAFFRGSRESRTGPQRMPNTP